MFLLCIARWLTGRQGRRSYANKIQIGTMKNIFLNRLVVGILLGVILIPVAILKKLFSH